MRDNRQPFVLFSILPLIGRAVAPGTAPAFSLMRAVALLLLAFLSVGITHPSISHAAATLTVCEGGCDYTTIASAIVEASPGDTINILDSFHSEAQITVDRDLTIRGQGAGSTTIDGGAFSSGASDGNIFLITSDVAVTIEDVTLSHGSASRGGAIYNEGTLTISDSVVSDNYAADRNGCCDGGGIYNKGTLTIDNTTFSENSAALFHPTGLGGGAIYNSGTLTIGDSTFIHNSGTYYGGAIFNDTSGKLEIDNSSIFHNFAVDGAGLANLGTVTIDSSTLSNNTASYEGDDLYSVSKTTIISSALDDIYSNHFGITIGSSAIGTLFVDSAGVATIINSTLGITNSGTALISSSTLFSIGTTGTTTVKNSIVSNCNGDVVALGTNLNTDGSCGSVNFRTVTEAQLDLDQLKVNPPGNTTTLALLPESVAIHAAPDCTDVDGNPVTTDQRGVARPNNGQSPCDIGSYQFVPTPFQSFTAKVTLPISRQVIKAITMNSAFTLGAGGDTISPVAESVALQIGTYSATIPAGSFKKKSKKLFAFMGKINGVSVNARITLQKDDSYKFVFQARGKNLASSSNAISESDLTEPIKVPKPTQTVSVTLSIGGNVGTISVET